jgi:CubicO group peptidase (beta-lactamase class C family)
MNSSNMPIFLSWKLLFAVLGNLSLASLADTYSVLKTSTTAAIQNEKADPIQNFIADHGSDIVSNDLVQPEWYIDRPREDHEAAIPVYQQQGYRLISLSVYGSDERYAAVWILQDGPVQEIATSLTLDDFNTWWYNWYNQGYSPKIVSATGSGTSAVFSGVVEKLETGGGLVFCAMTLENFINTANALFNSRNSIVSFTGYGTLNEAGDDERKFCAAWVPNSDFDLDRTYIAQDLAVIGQNIRFESTILRWRLAYASISEDGLYTQLFKDTDVGSWSWGLADTEPEIEAAIDQEIQSGRILIQIQGGQLPTGETTFHLIFAEHDSPSTRQWKAQGSVNGFHDNADAQSQIDTMMEEFMQQTGVRQAQLAIGKSGSVLLERAYTWSDSSRPITSTFDKFLLASVSKMFCAAAIASLIDDGKLSLNTAPWTTFFEETTVDGRMQSIKIENLLYHTAGWNRTKSGDLLLEMAEIARTINGGSGPPTMADIIRYLGFVQLDFDPGSAIVYSNIGYVVLARVVEIVSGMSYFDYLTSAVLKPMALDGSVSMWLTDRWHHENDNVIQEDPGIGEYVGNPATLNNLTALVFGGDGIWKESAVGPSSLAASASTLVRFIANHGKLPLRRPLTALDRFDADMVTKPFLDMVLTVCNFYQMSANARGKGIWQVRSRGRRVITMTLIGLSF